MNRRRRHVPWGEWASWRRHSPSRALHFALEAQPGNHFVSVVTSFCQMWRSLSARDWRTDKLTLLRLKLLSS
jgi:uncharacterized protein YhdP